MSFRITKVVWLILSLTLVCKLLKAECAPYFTIYGSGIESKLGIAVGGAGDVNNDGFDDVIFGAYHCGAQCTSSGYAQIISGKDGTNLSTVSDGLPNGFGAAVSWAGDINDDGFDDFVVGAYQDDDSSVNAGKAILYSGANGTPLYTFHGESSGNFFGYSVAGGGDLNGDDFPDILVSAHNYSNQLGRVYAFSGVDADTLFVWTGTFDGGFFGVSIDYAGDVNVDGFDDVIVGAYLTPNGNAYVYSGLDGTLLFEKEGEDAGDQFGICVSGAGDVNGDSFDDFIIGAGYNDAGGLSSGRVYVYSGINGELLYKVTGTTPGQLLGLSLDGVGDVDFDGIDDFLIGAPTQSEVGQVFVVSGIDGTIVETYSASGSAEGFGYSASNAGDVNGDGQTDIVIGAYTSDSVFVNGGYGAVYALSICCCNNPGDVDATQSVNIADVTALIARVFSGTELVGCPSQSNPNGDQSINIADVTYLIQRIFGGGPPPTCGSTF